MSATRTLIDTPVVGLPDLQRAAFYVLFENLNLIIPEVDEYWLTRDEIFDTRTGRNTAGVAMEPVLNDSFHEGHKPSLLLSGPDAFPNIAVFGIRADPSSEDASFDQLQSWSDQLLVEVMVKASDEDTVNRRIQRMTEAVVICLRQNPTLGGACTGMEGAPTIAISDVFAIKGAAKDAGTGPRFVWQGSSITWRVRKDSIAPASNGEIFSQASTFDYSQADIDQR